jgi:hypothetical protein
MTPRPPTTIQAAALLAALADDYNRVTPATAKSTRQALLVCGWSEGDLNFATLTDAGVLRAVQVAENRTRFMGDARAPLVLPELNERHLRPVQEAANKSMLPQTVWPSRFYGKDFVGPDCLLTSSAMGYTVPTDAAPDTAPLLTVLPVGYYPPLPEDDAA